MIKNKKAEFKISMYIISILLVGGVFLGMYGFMNDLITYSGSNITVDDHYKDTYNKVNEIFAEINRSETDTYGITGDKDTAFFTGLYDGFKVVKGVLQGTIVITKDFIFYFVSDLGFPNYVYYILIGIITILFIFALIYILTKVNQ